LIRVANGDPTDAMLAELEELAERTSDSFGSAAVHFLRGDRAFVRGDHGEASREMLAASGNANVGPLALGRGLRAALWSEDAPKVRELADRLDAHPGSLGSTVAARVSAQAGIAALEGRVDDAVVGYRGAIARFRAINHDFDLACTALDFVLVVGPENPAARAAGEEARVIFERVGARPYLEHLAAALARPAIAARATRSDAVGEMSGSPG